jgi:hypothetical protein
VMLLTTESQWTLRKPHSSKKDPMFLSLQYKNNGKKESKEKENCVADFFNEYSNNLAVHDVRFIIFHRVI